MATATVHKLPEAEPIDPHACLLQARGLLNVLVRNLGGEVPKEQRPSDADVQCTIETASFLIADGLRARPENLAAAVGPCRLNDEARALLRRALGPLRVIQAAAFIAAADSISGDVEQALSDDALVNALWAVAELVEKAEVANK